MTAVISSRTPEGEPFRCPTCGLVDRLEPSRPPGDVPCPSCGRLLWVPARPTRDHVEALIRSVDPSTIEMGSIIARSIGRLVRATRRLAAPRPRAEKAKSGVYDHWLDG